MRRIALLLVAATFIGLGLSPVAAGKSSSVKTVSFSGYDWTVRATKAKSGPGPNYFSDSASNVWVDASGRLHLKITYVRGRWYSAEVINNQILGYGSYTFILDSPVESLDPNLVLGLFTWSDLADYNHRELDIEFARWGNASDPTGGQFVVQPYTTAGNLVRVSQVATSIGSTQSFTWSPAAVDFSSSNGSPASWNYAGADVPPHGDEHVHMNLWLFNGQAPTDGKTVEVIVRSFTFTPAP